MTGAIALPLNQTPGTVAAAVARPRDARSGKTRLSPHTFGPWAVVTGASSGIGYEFARRIAACGINVVLVSRRLAVLEDVGQALAATFGVDYRAVEADLATEDGPGKVIAATADLDVGMLVSNAGAGRPGNFLSFSTDDLIAVARLNATSHLLLTHHFGQRLAARGRGGVLLVSAMGADEGIPYNAKEAAAKALVSSLGRGLNLEFKRLGLNMTVLIVSPTDTPIIDSLGFDRRDMPVKPMRVEQCVEEGLAAFVANKITIMPGRLYRIMNRLMPASASRRMTSMLMQKSTRFVK